MGVTRVLLNILAVILQYCSVWHYRVKRSRAQVGDRSGEAKHSPPKRVRL